MIESFNKKELEEKIHRYVNGQLSAQETDELWAELIQDEYHLDYLKSVANIKAVIDQKKEENHTSAARKYWYYAAAAVVALLIGVVGVINLSVNDSISVKPISSIELNYYRSGDGALATAEDAQVIQNAISLANTGKVGEAISLLNTELESASKPSWVAKIHLNLGSLYYNQGNYDVALSHYSKVTAQKEAIDVLVLEKAYWYSGNAYFHLGQLAEARLNIEKAYEINGAYRRVSQSYLDALSE